MATFPTDGIVGANITADGEVSARFAMNTTVQLSDGGVAIYVSATSTISTYMAVVIDDKGGAVPVTTTNSATSKRVGFAQVSIASSYFGWIQVGGAPKVQLAVNCAPNVPLYTTGTQGVLDDAVVSTGLVIGVTATTSISNATAVTCIASRGAMIASGDMD